MSFVLVSPSTESWSQVRAAAGRRRPHRTSGSTVASVSTTDSIVAIRGWIIPTPLAIPLTVIRAGEPPSVPGRSTVAVATLVFELVVRRATAAASSPSSVAESVGTIAANPAITLSSGSRVPMIPVERWSVRSTSTPVAAASIVRDGGLVGVARGPRRRVRAATRRDDRLGPAETAARVAGRGREMRP